VMTRRLCFGFGLNLQFIASAQLDAAVGILPAVELDM
jgi:hypothetical protein